MNILSTFTHDLSHEITLRVLCGVSVTCHHQPMWTPVRKCPAFVMQPLPAVFSRELKTERDEGCRIGHLRLGRIPVRGEAGRQATVLTAATPDALVPQRHPSDGSSPWWTRPWPNCRPPLTECTRPTVERRYRRSTCGKPACRWRCSRYAASGNSVSGGNTTGCSSGFWTRTSWTIVLTTRCLPKTSSGCCRRSTSVRTARCLRRGRR